MKILAVIFSPWLFLTAAAAIGILRFDFYTRMHASR